jgi:hypothetical protein
MLKLITGDVKPLRGTVSVSVDFAMLDERMKIVDPEASILENFTRLNPEANENACRAILAGFHFRPDAALCRRASGGQPRREVSCQHQHWPTTEPGRLRTPITIPARIRSKSQMGLTGCAPGVE